MWKLGVEAIAAAKKLRSSINQDGWSSIELTVERVENAVCDILSLGTDAVLLEPDAFIVSVREAVGQLAVQYDRSS